ncbi:hypothetical protein A3B40_05540 [Candidatus Roizmanbacteria bacterium RIFCSPLOWO2_01_FULL_37_16]|uniref:Glycosyltransferase RgtA/B/C/D-like domain-containing protein n=1 Tax=Candidatus Roizmanbacteria bacterium RIFCSPLOWO2_01_FULL_37_16 TaxID=1802058 RepID=A0A1F7IQX6_9BACT|nr:MAG: hypothetical protein A3B40_05540 [Candidatus Roizmanbacteria bacterium RIFCSPLOWO2_01_FULL_37_16]
MDKKLLLIFILALLVRLISIDQSLWLDEATTARVVKEYGFTQIVNEFSVRDFHPPLYYLFMKLWTNIFGYSEIVLRFPSVIFSLLTGYVIYKIAKLLNGYIIGIWASIFFLINPLIIYYSQEARMYMMVTFFLTVALYFLMIISHVGLASASVLKTRSRNPFGMTKSIVMFNIFSILAFVTFYGSIFLIIPVLIYILYKKKYSIFFTSCFLLLAVFFLLTPLLYQQFINARAQLRLVPNWTQVLGSTNLKNFLLIPLKFSLGRISFYPKWLYWVVSGLWTSFVFFFILKGGLKNKFLLFLVIGSLGLGILFSFFTPLLQYFRFLYLIPLICILMPLGLANLHLKGVNWIIVGGFIIWSLFYLLNPNFQREDWKSLALYLNKDRVYMIYSSSDPVSYYRKDLKIIDLKTVEDKNIIDPEIIIIPYTTNIHGIDYQKILKQKKYKLIKKEVVRGASVETWKFFK